MVSRIDAATEPGLALALALDQLGACAAFLRRIEPTEENLAALLPYELFEQEGPCSPDGVQHTGWGRLWANANEDCCSDWLSSMSVAWTYLKAADIGPKLLRKWRPGGLDKEMHSIFLRCEAETQPTTLAVLASLRFRVVVHRYELGSYFERLTAWVSRETSPASAMTPPPAARERLPLSDQARAVYEVLCGLPVTEGRTASQVVKLLASGQAGIAHTVDDDRVRRLVKELRDKRYEVLWSRSTGYYVRSTR